MAAAEDALLVRLKETPFRFAFLIRNPDMLKTLRAKTERSIPAPDVGTVLSIPGFQYAERVANTVPGGTKYVIVVHDPTAPRYATRDGRMLIFISESEAKPIEYPDVDGDGSPPDSITFLRENRARVMKELDESFGVVRLLDGD